MTKTYLRFADIAYVTDAWDKVRRQYDSYWSVEKLSEKLVSTSA